MMSKSCLARRRITLYWPGDHQLPLYHYDSSDAGGSYSNMISVRLMTRAALVIRNYG